MGSSESRERVIHSGVVHGSQPLVGCQTTEGKTIMNDFENEVLRKLIRIETRLMKLAEALDVDVKEPTERPQKHDTLAVYEHTYEHLG